MCGEGKCETSAAEWSAVAVGAVLERDIAKGRARRGAKVVETIT